MLFRLILICFVMVVLLSLFRALFCLVFPKKQAPLQMVKALSVRIGFSLFLFVMLIVGWYFNLWRPHSL